METVEKIRNLEKYIERKRNNPNKYSEWFIDWAKDEIQRLKAQRVTR